MTGVLSHRFWTEVAVTVAAWVAAAAAVVWPMWIEVVFGVDPDAGAGTAEAIVAAGFALAALVGAVMTASEWRRARIPRMA